MLARLTLAGLVVAGCGRVGYDAIADGGGAGDAPIDADPTCRFRSLALGRDHGCAVNATGAVYCWGEDGWGQTSGGGGGPPEATPVAVAIAEPVDEVAVSSTASCARTAAGAAYCWGALDGGAGGALGAVTPVDLGGAVHQLAGGIGFLCARLGPDDHVACWGDNEKGQLGVPPGPPQATPVAVAGTAGAIDLAVGHRSACARFADGHARCWGHDDAGELALGVEELVTPPTDVPALAGVTALALGGRHGCGVTGGALRCWGRNDRGELGDAGGGRTTPGPTIRSGVDRVVALARGSCALDTAGTVACTGQNRAGELGVGDLAERRAPTPVPGLAGVRRLAAGAHHACAEVAGAIVCWGEGDHGQLGRGDRTLSATPIAVAATLGGIADVVGTGHAACARTTGGALWCWGDGELGQLGTGAIGGTATPRQVLASGVLGAAAGGGHVAAWDAAGLWSWGIGYAGDGSGYGVTVAPVRAFAAPQITDAALGADFGCAVVAGAVRCWGADDVGQLGDGGAAAPEALAPVATAVAGTVVEVTAGAQHACARTAAGALACWGHNDSAQVGGGTVGTPVTSPVAVPLPGGVSAAGVAAGRLHTCALGSDQQVYCWGECESGQLGNVFTDQRAPIRVPLPAAATAVFARFDTSCAALADGRLMCWGAGELGSRGDGGTPSGGDPTPFGTVTGARSVGGSFADQCAVDQAGGLWCAGAGSRGTLGPALVAGTPAPALVPCQ